MSAVHAATAHLAKAGAGHGDDARLLQQLHAVHKVGGLALLVGSLDRAGRHREPREGVQGALHCGREQGTQAHEEDCLLRLQGGHEKPCPYTGGGGESHALEAAGLWPGNALHPMPCWWLQKLHLFPQAGDWPWRALARRAALHGPHTLGMLTIVAADPLHATEGFHYQLCAPLQGLRAGTRWAGAGRARAAHRRGGGGGALCACRAAHMPPAACWPPGACTNPCQTALGRCTLPTRPELVLVVLEYYNDQQPHPEGWLLLTSRMPSRSRAYRSYEGSPGLGGFMISAMQICRRKG